MSEQEPRRGEIPSDQQDPYGVDADAAEEHRDDAEERPEGGPGDPPSDKAGQGPSGPPHGSIPAGDDDPG